MAESALMTVLEHLGELRRRILRYAFVFLIALILCFHFAYEPIKYVVVAPLEALEETFRPLVRDLTPDMEPAVAFSAGGDTE